jgi:hypothetical protein
MSLRAGSNWTIIRWTYRPPDGRLADAAALNHLLHRHSLTRHVGRLLLPVVGHIGMAASAATRIFSPKSVGRPDDAEGHRPTVGRPLAGVLGGTRGDRAALKTHRRIP